MVSRELVTHHGCDAVSMQVYPCADVVQGDRFVGAMSVIKARAPVTGGNFGVWGGMFSTFDCAIKGLRQKEDAWNAIISGFMTGGCLALRSTCRHHSSTLPFLTWLYRRTQSCTRFGCCLRYLARCVRGCRCTIGTGNERRATATSMCVSSRTFWFPRV